MAAYSFEKNSKYVLKLALNVLGKCPRQHIDIDKFRTASLRMDIAYGLLRYEAGQKMHSIFTDPVLQPKYGIKIRHFNICFYLMQKKLWR